MPIPQGIQKLEHAYQLLNLSAVAAACCSDEPSKMGELLGIYQKYLPEAQRQLAQAVEAEDFHDIATVVHRVRSSFIFVGAIEYAFILKEMEILARNKMSITQLAKKAHLMDRAFQMLVADIEIFMGQQAEGLKQKKK